MVALLAFEDEVKEEKKVKKRRAEEGGLASFLADPHFQISSPRCPCFATQHLSSQLPNFDIVIPALLDKERPRLPCDPPSVRLLFFSFSTGPMTRISPHMAPPFPKFRVGRRSTAA